MSSIGELNPVVDQFMGLLWSVILCGAVLFFVAILLCSVSVFLEVRNEEKQKNAQRQTARQGEIDFVQMFAVKLERIELALEIMLLDDAHSQKGELEKLLSYVVNAKLTNAARLTTLLDEDGEPQPELAISVRDSVMAHVKKIVPELSPSF